MFSVMFEEVEDFLPGFSDVGSWSEIYWDGMGTVCIILV